MARVRLAARAVDDLAWLIESHGLPPDARARVARRLRRLRDFPRMGRELGGRWAGARFILGPWSWFVIVYDFDDAADEVIVLTMHDARSSSSATNA